jgi:hypothetical protein
MSQQRGALLIVLDRGDSEQRGLSCSCGLSDQSPLSQSRMGHTPPIPCSAITDSFPLLDADCLPTTVDLLPTQTPAARRGLTIRLRMKTQRRFLAKARPEAVLRYRSNSTARSLSVKATAVSHLLTRERGLVGCEELSWAGFGWQDRVAHGKSILCRKCNCPCSRSARRF